MIEFYLTQINHMRILSWIMFHNEQIIDVILTSLMLFLRGFFRKTPLREIFLDAMICALWSWYMKDLLVIFMQDGALSPLVCMALGYMGSNTAAKLLKLRTKLHLRSKR